MTISNRIKEDIIIKGINNLPNGLYRDVGSIADSRKLKKWFDGGIANKKVCFSGDSTTLNLTNFASPGINADGTAGRAQMWYPELRDVTVYARGTNGAPLATFVANGLASGYNLSDIIALDCDLYILSWGINDCRTTSTAAYSAADLQSALTAAVNAIRAAVPKACIILRTPNAHRTGAVLITGSATAQNMMTRYKTAYGALRNTYTDVVVLDTMSGMYPNIAYATGTSNPMINADGFHPSSVGYDCILHSVLRMIVPAVNYRDTDFNNEGTYSCPLSYDSTNSLPIWDTNVNPLILEGDDWYKVYRVILSSDAATYYDLAFQDYTLTNNATIGTNVFGSGTVPPGLVPGDIISLNHVADASHTFVMNVSPNANQGGGLMRWYNSPYHPSGIVTTALSDLPSGFVYRHKYAFCEGMKTLQSLLSSPTRYEQAVSVANPYAVARRFYIVTPANGSIIIQTIPSETGGDLSLRTFAVTDTLCIPGVTGGANPGTGAFGLLLTGATFAYDTTNQRVTITLAGVDFRNAVIPQGYVLSAT